MVRLEVSEHLEEPDMMTLAVMVVAPTPTPEASVLYTTEESEEGETVATPVLFELKLTLLTEPLLGETEAV